MAARAPGRGAAPPPRSDRRGVVGGVTQSTQRSAARRVPTRVPTLVQLHMSSTATAFEPPDARWDNLQATMHNVRATLPSGLVTVRWPDASIEQAVAALDRDGAFVLENAASIQACDAVREQMRPYVEASKVEGSNTSRPGAVVGRSRASWALATHPFLRQVCEGVLGRQVLTRTSDELAAELFADRGFQQHPYYLDISMLIAVGSGALAQDLHLDSGKHIMDFRPLGIETTISTMWALSDFTADGGATSLCLGSRHWGHWRRPSPDEATPAVMRKGSCLVFSGNTWHGSGENTSPNTRWGLNIDYSVAVSTHEHFSRYPPKTELPRHLAHSGCVKKRISSWQCHAKSPYTCLWLCKR